MNDGTPANVKVDFFDLSGDEAYSEVRNEFYSNIDGVLLVFDVTSSQSFESLDSWLNELRKYGVSTENTTIVLVGSKTDKYPREVKEQEVSQDVMFEYMSVVFAEYEANSCNQIQFIDQATSFAIERNLTYFETSAKTGKVDDIIDFLVEDAIKRGFYK